MPKIVWTPTNGERREYDFEIDDLMWAEVRAIQKVTGATGLMNIGEMVDQADGAVIPALLWVMRKREDPTLTFAALDDLKIREVDLQFDEDDDSEDSEVPKEESPPESPQPVEQQPAAEESPPQLSVAT